MVGDGFSIDPLEGRLTSPVSGEVVDLQPSRHAVTIRSAEGLEILMHIGLDTVRLGGEGFRAHVAEGQQVGAGDLLIDFDLDDVGRNAKSLLTQVVITNTELISGITPVTGLVNAGIDEAAVAELKAREEGDQESGAAVDAVSEALIVPNPTGLHARPTATLVALAKKYHSDIQLRRGDDSANAKSIVAIMSLAVACGEKVVVTAHGTDAKEAVAAMAAEAERVAGGLDLVISNAGIVRAGSVLEQDASAFKLSTDINYVAFFLVTKHLGGLLARQHEAAPGWLTDIIQINSKSGLVGSNKNAAYAGSKFGGIGLVQSFALELVEHGIKVNAVCPGNFYDGPLWSDPDKGLFVQYLNSGKVPGAKTVEDVKAFYEAKVPMRRGTTGIDVLRAIYYIVEQAYETGQAVPVTGGQVMLNA